MKLYTIKKYAAILLCLAAFTSCDTDAEGTKYGVNGVEAAFAFFLISNSKSCIIFRDNLYLIQLAYPSF